MSDVQSELDKTQIILAYVLQTAGPVEITDAALAEGLPAGSTIAIDRDNERELMVVRLANESEFKDEQ